MTILVEDVGKKVSDTTKLYGHSLSAIPGSCALEGNSKDLI